MTKIINFPQVAKLTVINEAHFEQFSDPALLLHCFESINDVVDFIEEGGAIQFQDDSYVQLIEAFWALTVLFKRKTGASASELSAEHWKQKIQHITEGGEPPSLKIPVVSTARSPFTPEAFDGLSSHALACAGYNYADKVRVAIMDHSPKAMDMAEARVCAIDATTVLRKLALSLAGEAGKPAADHVSRQPWETLQ
jgi:hypothetical protein